MAFDLLGGCLPKCGIVTLSVEGKGPDEMRLALARQAINVSVTTRSSTLLDMEARGFESLVWASVHYYNSEGEVGRFCRALSRYCDFLFISYIIISSRKQISIE